MLQLKYQLLELNETQAALARYCKVSNATIAQLVNHGLWPRGQSAAIRLRTRIHEFLTDHEVPDIQSALKEVAEPERGNAQALRAGRRSLMAKNFDQQSQEDIMLLRKQTLRPEAKKQFGMLRDPFGELQSSDDLWLGSDCRYIREYMYQTAKHGGFLAVIGESGAGKSTLRRDLAQRIHDDNPDVILIHPHVLASEDNDSKGKTLKSSHIAEAILSTVAPMAVPKSSPEARFKQVADILAGSHQAGFRHCLVIEEAHSLPVPTLKHLKRFLELEVGYTKLLSVILVGQPELQTKLSERNPAVREVVQRCEVATLQPIHAAALEDYLTHRLGRAGKRLEDVIDNTGITALVDRLRNREDESQLYPLAVGNFVVAAMNVAAQIGVPVITDQVIKGV